MATGALKGVAALPTRAVQGLLRQRFLHHLQGRAFFAKAAPQIVIFRNRETQIVGHDDSAGIGEDALERLDRLRFWCARSIASP